MDHAECVVVGAGVVGLAIARVLARAGMQVLVLEAAAGLAAGTSGRGSGVIHAGLYYPEGSLKARCCVAGKQALYAYAAAHGVPHRRLGKLVVATRAEEESRLVALLEGAACNGVDDLTLLDTNAARDLEPELRCRAAVLSPSTGVIDVKALLGTLQADAEEFGAVAAFRATLDRAEPTTGGFILGVGGAAPMRLGCRILVNAAGHGAPAVARAVEGLSPHHVPTGFFAKGSYFRLVGRAPFGRLIYPLPVPGGIGIHLTLDPAGRTRFGPDVEWVDHLDFAVDPDRAPLFYTDIRRWWPGLPDNSLLPDGAGVRPKLGPPSAPARDFVIEGPAEHGVAGLVNLFGIESPGVTAALAIADHVRSIIDAADLF